jgi:hypothetical protein
MWAPVTARRHNRELPRSDAHGARMNKKTGWGLLLIAEFGVRLS